MDIDVAPQLNPSQNRKRHRSRSMESSASSTSNKRAASDPRDPDDIDEYMATQGNQDDADSVQRRFELFQAYSKRELVIGQTWYLISKRWHRKWSHAHDPASKEPLDPALLGPVDNSDLFQAPEELKRPLYEGVDVIYLPEEGWHSLQQWHGQSSTPIARKVIGRGYAKEPAIEIFPPRLKVHRIVKDTTEVRDGPPVFVSVSESDTLDVLAAALFKAVAPAAAQRAHAASRVWTVVDPPPAFSSHQSVAIPVSLVAEKGVQIQILEPGAEKTVSSSAIQSGDILLVEIKKGQAWVVTPPKDQEAPAPTTPLFASGDGFFDKMSGPSTALVSTPRPSAPTQSIDSKAVTATKSPYFSNNFASRRTPQPIEPGTLGLGNLGNTCFMNSALQCLAHTKELTEYFLSGVFKKELNPDNPLGMQGAIAESYGSLIHRIWDDSTSTGSSYAPREFKSQLSRFAPQFSGYLQQDSQELVAFLLDGLHEDLNRVLKKPYVEKPDWPDDVAPADRDLELAKFAKKSWDGYKLRNDSVVVDLFQGQYQSTLICPECSKVSITFDPFMYLTLPIPVTKKWQHEIFFIPWDDNKPPLRVPVILNSTASFKEVRRLLGSWLGHPADNLITLEIWSGRFYKNLDDNIPVSETSGSDVIVCFQLPCHAQQSRTYKRKPGDPYVLPVLLTDQSTVSRYQSYNRPHANFGYPTIVVISEEEARSTSSIYAAVTKRLARWTKAARDLYQWEGDDVVDIRLNRAPPVDSIAEISETGEVVTVQEGGMIPEEEGDIVDEKTLDLSESSEQDHSRSPSLRCVGPKPGIFVIKLFANTIDYGASLTLSPRPTKWSTRTEEATKEEPSLLREDDSFILEFQENMKEYYFSEDQALWDPSTFVLFEHPHYKAAAAEADRQNGGSKAINFRDCLSEFTKEEELGEDDLWYCPRCKKHQQATKKFDLWKVPDILVVHLKRFSNNRLMRDKIDAFVDFPITALDLTLDVGERRVGQRLADQGVDIEELGIEKSELDESLVYDLFAVDEHLGGLGGGHYRAYALNHSTNRWYHFDDSYVTSSDARRAINANAYLLFYRRRTGESGHLGGVSHLKTAEALSQGYATEQELDDSTIVDSANPTLSASWVSVSATDQSSLPGTSHSSIPPEENEELTALSENEWGQHLPFPSSSNATSSRTSTPASESDQTYPDPLATATKQYDDAAQQFTFPDPMNGHTSPASSTGAEPDSDRDLDDPEWRDGRSCEVLVTSPQDSPKWKGTSPYTDSLVDAAELLEHDEDSQWVHAA